jgi:hypothetical protein
MYTLFRLPSRSFTATSVAAAEPLLVTVMTLW